MKKSVYVLTARDPDIKFYVGCTSDITRRASEHKNNAVNQNHKEYNTYKYRFIRELNDNNVVWDLSVLSTEIEVDETTDEYSWILKIARENEIKDHLFYDDTPLTNMKAGDFLEEMLKDKELSGDPQSVKNWITTREQKASSYERNSNRPTRILDLYDEANKQVKIRQAEEDIRIEKKIKRLEKQLAEIIKLGLDRPVLIASIQTELNQLSSFNKLFNITGEAK
jgi:hypothetical protein|tara:strand:- start:3683 stop:4354 length:672 start_codon:yes stop_codon:yes gene_type:complete